MHHKVHYQGSLWRSSCLQMHQRPIICPNSRWFFSQSVYLGHNFWHRRIIRRNDLPRRNSMWLPLVSGSSKFNTARAMHRFTDFAQHLSAKSTWACRLFVDAPYLLNFELMTSHLQEQGITLIALSIVYSAKPSLKLESILWFLARAYTRYVHCTILPFQCSWKLISNLL